MNTEIPAETAHLASLRAELAERAEKAELLDVAYRRVDSPVGPLLLAATARGLVRVAFEREDFDAVVDSLATRLGSRILSGTARLDDAAREVEEYFSGNRRHFDLELDRSLSAGFRLEVQRYLPRIDYGRTLSYAQVADSVGNPQAVRAVGSACARNPLPIVVPCHRVVRTDGSLGGYIGGLEAKKALLGLEAAA
ncbi:MAG: methylated-DNA--[protein]-cysteine S-methyltransferase [Micrococcaceae bacterium]|uniref:methylated-DNA--[protein]-cysteine S-methyltransferase n=1 Tax=Arthrobacter sp. 179 TaxID=3457734 RepID=UPI00264E5284|nr:methylated-DNA--[protein]-cysteine S-methyltransferase [Micrococcaceae bacterium]MDN5812022.1 methylated-DNA--[protein]-cysteine S-methyltransferase [Micrococcaceae bacterium]MDN5880057.1 methylated-DNA--[protein]-cysteine S-methyltransferase [Micrococcaceae bacterium]MDN5886096.1 methylated-DNA--[protein]-cysteine S-methyltransferase [Micrococcaceae bacterium]MDN5905822.1 methylated-DNA--[protein]-cysteine S-methyltransferase [Micrococcaceae bacterium]